jgi:hypothetical protein
VFDVNKDRLGLPAKNEVYLQPRYAHLERGLLPQKEFLVHELSA